MVQPTDRLGDVVSWDSPRAALRGHKQYWHRPGAVIETSTEKVATQFQKARDRLRFRSVIRYENLCPIELGVLLVALDLPNTAPSSSSPSSAHHLGLGKPIGLGSFRIEIQENGVST